MTVAQKTDRRTACPFCAYWRSDWRSMLKITEVGPRGFHERCWWRRGTLNWFDWVFRQGGSWAEYGRWGGLRCGDRAFIYCGDEIVDKWWGWQTDWAWNCRWMVKNRENGWGSVHPGRSGAEISVTERQWSAVMRSLYHPRLSVEIQWSCKCGCWFLVIGSNQSSMK